MADNAYATVDELKDFLCLADNDRDYALDNIVTTASRLIDRWTTNPAAYTQVRDNFLKLRYEEDPTLLIDELVELANEAAGATLTRIPFPVPNGKPASS